MNQLAKDIKEIISDCNIPWKDLNNSIVAVTGASGLLGSLILKTLATVRKKWNLNITILGISRDPEKAESKLRDLLGYVQFATLPDFLEKGRADYIIHTGSPTSSAFFVSNPVEVVNTIYEDLNNLLSFCRKKTVKAFVQLSTMEIYGDTAERLVNESGQGKLDPFSVRSSYPEAKRVAETLCKAYAEEYQIPCKVIRLTQCFGAGVDLEKDQRVFADFLHKALQRKPIALYTKGETCRSYIYTTDALRAIFLIMLKGKQSEAYNVANPASYCSIAEMAKLVANLFDTTFEIRLDSELSRKFNPTHKINLDISKLEKLGWTSQISLSESFLRMARSV